MPPMKLERTGTYAAWDADDAPRAAADEAAVEGAMRHLQKGSAILSPGAESGL
jgi:hypothetical protein